MDSSKKFADMLDKALSQESYGFKNFDITKNVQDQLQEMILKDWIGKKPCWLLFKFYNWVNLAEKENSWIDNYTSMEQLWLAFVMKEKYQKIWSGKDWRDK